MAAAVQGKRSRPSFVGRRHELTQLQAGIERVLNGRGASFLIAGEPGIGKTRLADELSALAAQQGLRVFWGRCWEGGGAPAFWPWVQVLRALVASDLWPPLAQDAPTLAAEIAQVVPQIDVADSDAAPRVQPADPEQARFRLFDSVTQALKRVAARTPLAIVLDDLHDGDLASLLLLRFLAREIRETRIYLLGTYRDVEARRSPTLAPVFGQLVRESQYLHLSGLSPAEVENFIDSSSHLELPRTVKIEVHRATEGNPFYVDEVARVLAARASSQGDASAEGMLVQIPDTVRAAIRERIDPLSPWAREVLTIAAVLGREFETALVERMLPGDKRVLSAMEETTQLGIVRKAPAAGKYLFTHALIRDTIHDDLPAAQRAELHRRVGEELERRALAGAGIGAAQLAHHFLHALPIGTPEKAIQYATQAGDEALRQLAYEQAVRHYKDAQDILDQHESAPAGLAELLLKLGDAQRWGGDLSTGRGTFHRAATLARQMLAAGPSAVAVSILARAALGYARVSETGRVDHDLVGLLEETLVVLGEADSSLRSRLLARLAVGLYFSGDRERREAYSREAIAIAERLGDRSALVNALVAQHFTIWGPDSLAERLHVASRVVRLCEELGEHETELEARTWRIADLLEAAHIEAAAAEHQNLVRLADHHRFPLYLWHARMQQSMYATIEGRFADAESLAQQAAAIGSRAELTNTHVFYVSQLLALRILQERSGEIEAQVREVAERIPSMPIWRIGHIVTLIQLGRRGDALAGLRHLSDNGFTAVPRDGMWISCLTLLAQACVSLDERAPAATLYELLLPYGDRICVSGSGISSTGAVALALGRLALLRNQPTAAAKHLQQALALLERWRARPYVAQTQYALALAWTESDPVRASSLAAQAAACAAELEMKELAQQTARLQGTVAAAAATAGLPVPGDRRSSSETMRSTTGRAPSPATPTSAHVFRREGEFWSLVFQGTVLRMKDSKGLRYVAHLLAHPGVDIHSIDLSTVYTPGHATAAVRDAGPDELSVSADLGDCGEILDAQAIAAYKRRLRDLQDDLKEAEAHNDLGRSQNLKEEILFLTRQLAAATGLGGRQRRAGGHAEKARINVTKAISSAIKKIRTEHPALGRFLSTSIKTGTFCSYTPDAANPAPWEL